MLELRMHKRPLAYVSIEGKGIANISGILSRFSQALAKKSINIHSVNNGDNDVGFFVSEDDAESARSAVAQETLKLNCISDISIVRGIGMITLRGEKIYNSPQVLERLSKVLEDAGISTFTFVSGVGSIKCFLDVKKRDAAFEVLEKNVLLFSDAA